MRKLLLLLAAAATADDAAIIEGRKFAILLASNVPDQNPGKVALARDKHGVRGLIAAQPFAAGDVLLAVPLERCLVETRDLPAAMKNAPAALTWDIRLALQLHDAILTPDDPFWVEYGTLLPKVEEMGLPLLKRGAELDALGEELAEPIQLQLESKADGDFASKHGALAARARSKPWEDWDEKEQGDMRAFLADVKVHGVAYDEDDFDAKRLAAFPQFEAPDAKSTADPQQIARLLARHGVFPELNDAVVAAELLERGVREENAGLTSDLVAALRDPASREHRRAAAARRARGERGLLDRLAVAEALEPRSPSE